MFKIIENLRRILIEKEVQIRTLNNELAEKIRLLEKYAKKSAK